MKKILEKHFESLDSDDLKIVRESLLIIVALMEMHAWELSIEERKKRFDYLYDRDILELELNDFELKECVDRICQILYPLLKSGHDFKLISDRLISTDIVFTLLRALEESPSRIALAPSLHLFCFCCRVINDRVYCQIADTLSELIVVDSDLTKNQKKSILENTNVLDILKDKLSIFNDGSVDSSFNDDFKKSITFLIGIIENLMMISDYDGE
jgi:hypothetical protein